MSGNTYYCYIIFSALSSSYNITINTLRHVNITIVSTAFKIFKTFEYLSR